MSSEGKQLANIVTAIVYNTSVPPTLTERRPTSEHSKHALGRNGTVVSDLTCQRSLGTHEYKVEKDYCEVSYHCGSSSKCSHPCGFNYLRQNQLTEDVRSVRLLGTLLTP